jgi:hypothetical protein
MKPLQFRKWFEAAVVHDDAINRSQYLSLFDPKKLSRVNGTSRPGEQQDDPMRPDYLPKLKREKSRADKLFGFMRKT